MRLPIDLNERDIDRLSAVSEANGMTGAEAAVMLIQQGLARYEAWLKTPEGHFVTNDLKPKSSNGYDGNEASRCLDRDRGVEFIS